MLNSTLSYCDALFGLKFTSYSPWVSLHFRSVVLSDVRVRYCLRTSVCLEPLCHPLQRVTGVANIA